MLLKSSYPARHQVRPGRAGLLARSQDSVAVSADGEHWFLLNDTNPLLDEHSSERTEVVASGWEVAVDGMQLRIE